MQDHHIEWMRKRIVLSPFDLLSLNQGTSVFEALTAAGVTFDEIGALGFGSVTMTDGELLNGIFPVPYDIDPSYPIGFRVGWTMDHDGAGNADATWILLADAIAHGAAIAVATTALNTAIGTTTYKNTAGVITSVTDFLFQKSNRGIKNLIGLSRAQIEAGALMSVSLEMDAATNETSIRFLHLEMDYVPQLTVGMGSHINRPLQSNGIQ